MELICQLDGLTGGLAKHYQPEMNPWYMEFECLERLG